MPFGDKDFERINENLRKIDDAGIPISEMQKHLKEKEGTTLEEVRDFNIARKAKQQQPFVKPIEQVKPKVEFEADPTKLTEAFGKLDKQKLTPRKPTKEEIEAIKKRFLTPGGALQAQTQDISAIAEVIKPDIKAIKPSFKAGIAVVKRGDIAAKGLLGFESAEETLKKVNEIDKNIPEIKGKGVLSATAELLPFVGQSLGAGAVGGLAGLIGGPGGAVALSRAGAFGSAFAVEGGNTYADCLKQGIDAKVCRPIGLAVGTINGGLEIAQLSILTRLPGGKTLFRKKLVNKLLSDKKAMGAITRFTTDLGAEIGIEELQEGSSILGDVVGNAIDAISNDKEYKGPGLKEAFRQLANTFVQSLKGFPLLLLGGRAVGAGVGQLAGETGAVAPELISKPTEAVTPVPAEITPPIEKPTPPVKPAPPVKEVKKELFTGEEIKPPTTEDIKQTGIKPVPQKEEVSEIREDVSETKSFDMEKVNKNVKKEVVSETSIPQEKFDTEITKLKKSDIVNPYFTDKFKKFILDTKPNFTEKKVFKQTLYEDTTRNSIRDNAERLSKSFEKQKDVWFGKKDVGILKADNEANKLQKEILSVSKEKRFGDISKKMDMAIQIYIDSKRNPEHIKKFRNKLTEQQKEIVDLSQNLPKEAKAIADKIRKSYENTGAEALDAKVIRNVLDNYAGRIWENPDKIRLSLGNVFKKFSATTPHAKARTFETIIEGWARGHKLKVKGATSNLKIIKKEIIRTIADKQFIEGLKQSRTTTGEQLVSSERLEGYKRIEHRNFKSWDWVGKAVKGKVYTRDFFISDDGNVFKRGELYAPADLADNLNNILGVSKLKGIPAVDVITKYNAILKSWILQTSLFHHLAFMRSYWLGTNHKKFSEMNATPFGKNPAYQQGLKAIEDENPITLLGVKNGLTLGLKQDWNEELLREKTAIGNLLDKLKVTKVIKDKIVDLRERQADFLFGKYGAGLKAKAFMIEFRNEIKKNQNEDVDVIAKRVARLINDDFGGLHLQRLGRRPTTQHIFRIFALAPDWTESNVRTMVKAIKGGTKSEGRLYRRFWAGIFTKAMILQVMSNLLMSAFDEKDFWERYKIAWRAGHLRWLDVDITPLYKALGGKTTNRKYFSILGHFRDPVKFATHPIRSAKHKGSVVFKIMFEALTGTNWQGKRFTTIKEIAGIDYEKGVYKTTSRKYGYKKGDKKSGKLTGKTVTWAMGKEGPVGYSRFASYLLSQIKGTQPVQIQNLIAWLAGEMEGFNAFFNSLGFGISTVREQKSKATKKLKKETKKTFEII